ncbi:MAG: hypothetical protein EA396_09400 [Anaerolineaceae bacterium]|nr:MAG: hypothetical protein EA396_09400 [Anaerolineaceae bacterium]
MTKMRFVFMMLLSFALVLALPLAAQDDDEGAMSALVNVGESEDFDAFLVGPDGMTLYMFVPDDANCVDQCLANWPPLTVESADDLTLADGIPGTLGIYEREDMLQVTYNDMPLYYFVADEEPGDMMGEGINNVWYVVEPVMIYAAHGHEDFGSFLVGPEGMTLYLFVPDDANCVDQCLVNWPPLTVESADDITISQRLSGETGVFEREDGTLQVTYDDIPLYYFINDMMIGDVNGQGVNDVWYIINTIGTRVTEEAGEYLVGPNGFALYLFVPDDANCVDQCLVNWPPLMVPVEGAITLSAGLTGEIGFFDRDGDLQVTYEGLPLYYFINDASPAEINGQGVNDVWFLITPDGEAVELEGEAAE